MEHSKIENAIKELRARQNYYCDRARSSGMNTGTRNALVQLIDDIEYTVSILEFHTKPEGFKLLDSHAPMIKPFILGLVWEENGEQRGMDFELPFDEIKGIFNQVVENIAES